MKKTVIKLAVVCLLATLMTGCGTLIPKKVEFGQDKVEEFPVRKDREIQIQRQAAHEVDEQARELVEQAIRQDLPTNVVEKIKDVAELTDSLSDSLGPPVKRPDTTPERLAITLDSTTGRFINRVQDFAEENDENVGKKIEGTGKIQIPYFVYIFGLLVTGVIGFTVFRIAMGILKTMNPAVGVGLNAVEMGAGGAAKALGQVLKGGKRFLGRLSEVTDDPALQEKIARQFKASQKESQDETTQDAVKKLVKD